MKRREENGVNIKNRKERKQRMKIGNKEKLDKENGWRLLENERKKRTNGKESNRKTE